MASPIGENVENYQKDPVLWITLARILAENPDSQAPPHLVDALATAPRPIIRDPHACRKEFWGILAAPHRHLGIGWLDKHGLLEELIPCWRGNPVRRVLRLNALEQVHLEAWKTGLGSKAFKAIADVHEIVVDRRLNRWALTALGTLFAGGDTENQRSWARMVRHDLHELGATEAELVWVDRIVRDINPALLYLRGHNPGYELRPEQAVAGLSTLQVTEPEIMANAAKRADEALTP